MSPPPNPEVAAELIAAYQSIEVEYFWKRKLTGPSILYLSSKYLALALQAIDIATQLPVFTPTRSVRKSLCEKIQKAQVIVDCSQYVLWGVFAALRAYVLSNRSRAWSTVVFVLSLASPAINLSPLFVNTFIGYIDPIIGCSFSSNITAGEVMSVPWRRNIFTQSTKFRTLQNILVRDGTIYFVLIGNSSTTQLFSADAAGGGGSYIWSFTEVCTTMLINRFLLHLQEAGTRTLCVSSDNPLHLSLESSRGVPSFVRVIGSIAYRDSAENGHPPVANGDVDPLRAEAPGEDSTSGSAAESSTSPSELLAIWFVNSCCTLAATVLLMYECMITFDHEVEYFWKRTFPGASALYIFNKYLALVVSGLSLATYFPVFTDKLCKHSERDSLVPELTVSPMGQYVTASSELSHEAR
ncbi:hypothetical protein C8Q76DRAFT_690746 [Earliella scabrosa]|nr:hypothetical protein C8Q76DRAFT_690746 [Earliella scabrosa]